MTGFADLIPIQPSLFESARDDGWTGRSWEYRFELTDDDDALIDLSEGYVGVCEIYNPAAPDTVVTALDVAFTSDGLITMTKSATDTAVPPGKYGWRAWITETATGKSIQLWGGDDATFTVHPH